LNETKANEERRVCERRPTHVNKEAIDEERDGVADEYDNNDLVFL
jgi:hypothetical protein